MENRQMSDSLIIGIFLAVIGGFLDAYTYLCRGQVFANAQTGNIVLLGIHFMEGHFNRVLYYLLPVIAFVLGILLAEKIRKYYWHHSKIHWRQIILVVELIVLMLVMFIPTHMMDMVCNVLISFVCSLQVQSFRKFQGYSYASTMCTGNLRSATEYLFKYNQSKEKEKLYVSLKYYMIIFFFIVGAGLGTIFTNWIQSYALIFCEVILLLVILILNKKQEV